MVLKTRPDRSNRRPVNYPVWSAQWTVWLSNRHWTVQTDGWTVEPDDPSGFLQTGHNLKQVFFTMKRPFQAQCLQLNLINHLWSKPLRPSPMKRLKHYYLGHVFKPNLQHSLFKNNTCIWAMLPGPAWWLVWLKGWKAFIEHMEHIKFLCFRCGIGNETIRGKHCFGRMEVMELWFYFKILSYKIFKKI